jgi:hypothetical protein
MGLASGPRPPLFEMFRKRRGGRGGGSSSGANRPAPQEEQRTNGATQRGNWAGHEEDQEEDDLEAPPLLRANIRSGSRTAAHIGAAGGPPAAEFRRKTVTGRRRIKVKTNNIFGEDTVEESGGNEGISLDAEMADSGTAQSYAERLREQQSNEGVSYVASVSPTAVSSRGDDDIIMAGDESGSEPGSGSEAHPVVVGSGSGESSSERQQPAPISAEDDEWERAQLRRVLGKASGVPSGAAVPTGTLFAPALGNEESESSVGFSWRNFPQLVDNSSATGSGVAFEPTTRMSTKRWCQQFEEVVKRAEDDVARASGDANRAREAFSRNEVEISTAEKTVAGLSSESAAYSSVASYFTDLCGCLQTKLQLIDTAEQNLRASESALLEHLAHQVAGVPEELLDFSVCRIWSDTVAERLLGACRRASVEDDPDETVGLDTNLLSSYKQRLALMRGSARIFDDVVDDFSEPGVIIQKLDSWRAMDVDVYTTARGDEEFVPQLLAPFVRLRLLSWNPLVFHEEDAVKGTVESLIDPFRTVAELPERDTDGFGSRQWKAGILTTLVTHLAIPKVCDLVARNWSVFSARQTEQVAKAVACLVGDNGDDVPCWKPAMEALPEDIVGNVLGAVADALNSAFEQLLELSSTVTAPGDGASISDICASLGGFACFARNVGTLAGVAALVPEAQKALSAATHSVFVPALTTITSQLSTPPFPTVQTQHQLRGVFVAAIREAFGWFDHPVSTPSATALRRCIAEFSEKGHIASALSPEDLVMLQNAQSRL